MGITLKRSLLPLAFLSIVLCGCGDPASPSATPSVTPTVTSSGSPSPTTSGPVAQPPNVSCHEISFYLDPAIGSGYTCETVPASTIEYEPYPEHTRVALEGYPLSGTFFEAAIDVYPIADYTALVPASIPGLVADLGVLAGGGPAPVFTSSFGMPLPFLPTVNAAQAFFAQYGVIPFISGDGIRYLTEIAQYYVPVNNTDLIYTYQGRTDDDQYWVSVIMPINLTGLPADADAGFGGQTQEQFSNGYEAYIATSVGQLNAAVPDSFTPGIDDLDALVASISITP